MMYLRVSGTCTCLAPSEVFLSAIFTLLDLTSKTQARISENFKSPQRRSPRHNSGESVPFTLVETRLSARPDPPPVSHDTTSTLFCFSGRKTDY